MLNDVIVTRVRECVEVVCPKMDSIKKADPREDPTLQKQIKDLKQCSNHKKCVNYKKN